MTEIAEAYFHVEPLEISNSALQRFGQQLVDIAGEAAAGIFDPDCIIEVRLKSGTLTAWALVVTSASLLGGGILKYRDFKSNLIEMVEDAKKFGSWVNRTFIHKNNIPPSRVYRTESRTKTPGKLLRVVRRQDRLSLRAPHLSAEEIERETKEINRLTRDALDDLPPSDRPIVMALLTLRAEREADKSGALAVADGRRKRKPLGRDLHQHELFGDQPDLHSIPLPPERQGLEATDDEGGEFYARLRLRDWQAHHGRPSLPRTRPTHPD
jgi:hypothetical protein